MDIYKLYTDGSFQPEDKIAGIGGYLVNPKGEVVFEFSEQITDSKFFKYHESMALLYGLKKTRELGVDCLECFADDISMRNILNKDYLSEMSANANPFRQEIFQLKKEFQIIHFHHLPRKFNKKADKLAGKVLRIYNEDIMPNRTRQDFIGQEDKLFHIPQLICQEDFTEEKAILKEWNGTDKIYFVHIFKTCETQDNISDYNPLQVNIYSINRKENKIDIIHSENIIQKKLMSKGLEILRDVLAHEASNHIGLMFYSVEQPLQKLDMLLRKRWVLPMPDTPLTRSFKEVTNRFSKIILHNEQNLIHSCLNPVKKYNVMKNK